MLLACLLIVLAVAVLPVLLRMLEDTYHHDDPPDTGVQVLDAW